jgi:hypothetical protein
VCWRIRPPTTLPLEGAFAPGVGQADEEDAHEGQDGGEGRRSQLSEIHGPGEDEHGLDVENDENEGEQIKTDVRGYPRGSHGVHAALVGGTVLPGASLAQKERRDQGPDGEEDAEEEENEDVKMLSGHVHVFIAVTRLTTPPQNDSMPGS